MACKVKLYTRQEGIKDESKTFGKEDLRKMQDHQETRTRYGDLRKSEAQAETGLIYFRPAENK